MLKKLFHYDMKQLWKVMLPIIALIIGVSLLGSAAYKINTEFFSSHLGDASLASAAASSILYLLFGLSIFALFALAVLAFILILARYYKNFFSDEGYLTFTLPVKTRSLLFSKLWSAALWSVIITLFVLCGVAILALFGSAAKGELINHELIRGLSEVLGRFFDELPGEGVLAMVLVLVCVAAQLMFAIMLIYLAITIGSIVAKKHKILASIGFVYLLNLAVNAVSVIIAICAFSSGVAGFGEDFLLRGDTITVYATFWRALSAFLAVFTVYYGALATVGFGVNNHLLKKKLNLE